MRRHWPKFTSSGPDKLSEVVVDVRTGVDIAVWGEEYQSWDQFFGLEDFEVEDGSM